MRMVIWTRTIGDGTSLNYYRPDLPAGVGYGNGRAEHDLTVMDRPPLVFPYMRIEVADEDVPKIDAEGKRVNPEDVPTGARLLVEMVEECHADWTRKAATFFQRGDVNAAGKDTRRMLLVQAVARGLSPSEAERIEVTI